jgi:superfamily II DNA or RNA helicase
VGLEQLLGSLSPDEHRRGREFERLCKWFLLHDPVYRLELRRAWLWDEWPGRWAIDAGIDVVAEDRRGGLWAVQCKAYDPAYSVTKKDVNTFLSESSRSVFAFRLLIATTNRVGRTAQRTLEAQEKPASLLLRADLEASAVAWPTSLALLRAPRPSPKRPWPHVRVAIGDVTSGFGTSDRGQLIMACGTGKTLASLFIAEKLAATRTLVLVPSLSLLAQTLREWTANASVEFDFLPVCSDETVVEEDALVANTSELGVPVTTDPAQIAGFLRKKGCRVVFGTYQSSPRIADAQLLGRVPKFDLVIADEAHRCAGRVSSDFATVLRSNAIRSQRRLFMTATPRYFTGRIVREAKEADFEIASMEDETTFGPVFHRLTFGEAIDRNLLTDYQVAIIGVDDETYRDWAERGQFVTTDGTKVTDARSLAGQIGLAKTMRKYDLRRTITFHSRVAAARTFSREYEPVVAWMPGRQRPKGKVWCDYASGEMTSGERARRLTQLRDLEDADRGLLANARCLAEGVDVPTLDAVAFIDPRRSEVDIVQAVGRAIRKTDAKKVGTIVLPVFIGETDDPEIALDDSAFKPVWDVLNALRAHDEVLAEQLDALRKQLGRRDRQRLTLPSKIHVDLPRPVGADFARAFDARLVEQTTASWHFWLGLLEGFAAREGHASPTSDWREDGHRLGQWVNSQRALRRVGELQEDRQISLSALPGWRWAPFTEKWEEGFAVLNRYVAMKGHARVVESEVFDGYPIGRWVARQRTVYRSRSRELSARRVVQLERLPGWSWNPFDAVWEDGYSRLQAYVERERHSRVQRFDEEQGFRLGHWVSAQRTAQRKGRLSTERARRLEALPGWTWRPNQDSWEERLQDLKSFAQRTGHSSPRQSPDSDSDHDLAKWVTTQRNRYREGTLDADEIERLEALPGWSWDPRESFWSDALEALRCFVERERTARVPSSHVENGLKLGSWVAAQRVAHRRGQLSPQRTTLLASVPDWQWKVNAERWESHFAILRAFVDREGSARVPSGWMEGDFKLWQWVTVQRRSRRQGRLSADQIARLEAQPDWTW